MHGQSVSGSSGDQPASHLGADVHAQDSGSQAIISFYFDSNRNRGIEVTPGNMAAHKNHNCKDGTNSQAGQRRVKLDSEKYLLRERVNDGWGLCDDILSGRSQRRTATTTLSK